MNKKNLFLPMLVLICLSVSLLESTICSAQETGVTITSVNALLVKNSTVGTRQFHYYNIYVVLHNSGNTASEDITVKFHDPEYNQSLGMIILRPEVASLLPGETKTYNITAWPTSLTGNVPINISFSPSSLNIPPNKTNSGYYLYTLHIGTTNTKKSTPGFELAFVFIAIMLFALQRKIKT
jgi:hypothetical protein